MRSIHFHSRKINPQVFIDSCFHRIQSGAPLHPLSSSLSASQITEIYNIWILYKNRSSHMAYHVCSCFIFLLFQHIYLCLKILFLKPDLFFDLLSCHGHIFRNCHPFVFHIIKAVDDGYHFSCKFFYRMIDPQNVTSCSSPSGAMIPSM